MNRKFFPLVFSLVIGSSWLAVSGCKKSDKKVLLHAGSIKITDVDFERELVNLPQAYHTYLTTIEGKKQLLDILLKERILLDAAEKSGVGKKKDVQKRIAEYLEQQKQDAVDFKKGILLREYLRELQDGQLKVTDPEMKAYYQEHEAEFKNPRKIQARHILTSTKEEAEAALARIKKGETFGAVAQAVSKDPSAVRGGKIGDIARGDLPDMPEFEDKLFSLKAGQVSDVVKTKIGFHIITKDGEVKLPGMSYDDAVPQVRRILEKKKFDQWIEDTKKKSNVVIEEQALSSVRIPSAEVPSGSIPGGAQSEKLQ